MNGRSEPTTEARQRWRIVVRRGDEARDLSHREVETAWEHGLRRAGLPVAVTGAARPRPRLLFAAPVPVGVSAEREPLDLFLSRRLTIAEVRERLLAALPPGHRLVDLHDVWVGAPSLAGRVIGADYRAEVDADRDRLARAVTAISAAASLPRTGRKGDPAKPYDLRALIVDLRLGPPAGTRIGAGTGTESGSVVLMRLRHQSEVGVGRPDEVLAALGEAAGLDLSAARVVREGLVLSAEH